MPSSSNQIDALAATAALMERWNRECYQGSATPIDILKSLCEIVEQQTEAYFKTDPDPFDDRHPGRADPNCTLGHVLKMILKNDDFIRSISHTYLSRDQSDLNVITCRVLLNLMPGLEASAVFKDETSSVNKFFRWAEGRNDQLKSYSIGILSYIMECQENASVYKEQNHKLVPILMRQLHSIIDERKKSSSKTNRPFSQFASSSENAGAVVMDTGDIQTNTHGSALPDHVLADSTSKGAGGEFSNSSWQEMEPLYIQSYQIYPVTPEVQQRLILSYLTPMGEYQELLPEVFQNRAMDIVFHYLDYQKNCDVRLGFAAVRYLASLLCHKKFGIEFINNGGLGKFLSVPRPSLAATGLSLSLYYLAFFEDTMERVCMQSTELLTELLNIILWLLECSHQSGRMHAVMFLSNALAFKAVLTIFDEMDGLRKLYNVLSTSQLLNCEAGTEFTDDQMYVFRQGIRHVAFALKKYYESHACIMADTIRQSVVAHHDRDSPSAELSPYKIMKSSVAEDLALLLECMQKKYWKPAILFKNLNGVELFLKAITLIADMPAYNGKAESVRWLLDTLAVCSVYPQIQLELCKTVDLPDHFPDRLSSPAISIILAMADTDILCDAEVQKSALNIIINLVCAPSDKPPGSSVHRRGRSNSATQSPFLQSLWDAFRQNNGIMVLLKLLGIQAPLTGADAIRALACQALVGLSRSDGMCQIMSKLPLFNNGQLQVLMKEPVLQDKRYEQLKFCKYASQLIEQVCGRPQNLATDTSLEHIRKAEVVAQTKIIYKEKELLQLIHDHLQQKGLDKAAAALQKEANLPVKSCSVVAPPTTSQFFESPVSQHGLQLSSPGAMKPISTPGTPGSSAGTSLSKSTPISQSSLRFHIKSSPFTSQIYDSPRVSGSAKHLRAKQDIRSLSCNISAKKTTLSAVTDASESMNLDKIITSYFRKQHALCKNPVVTCPPFSLYEPHVCPEPARKNVAPANLTARVLKHQAHQNYGGYDGVAMNRKYKYSRFKPIKTYKDVEKGSLYTCCTFSACEQWLMLGTDSGDLKLYNVQAGEEAETYNCHNSAITHAEPSQDGLLLLTSSAWGIPQSALWSMDNFFDQKTGFEVQYMEFSKSVQDRIVGTSESKAYIYDVATGDTIMTLYDENKANNYIRNQATFNCTDDLILSDGVLWDVMSGKAVHKFDKFNPSVSGLFHPLGLEVIINSEIWDLRTFKLLHTVPALNQCQIKFSHDSSVLYGAVIPFDDEEEDGINRRNLYGSSFRTFDARNYNCLATIDAKRSISDLCTDKFDILLAVVESHKDTDTLVEDSQCRLYEIGAIKDAEGMTQEEDDDEGEHDDDDDDEDDEVEDDMGGSDGEIIDIVDEVDADDDETDDAENGNSSTDDDEEFENIFINASDLSDSD